MRQRLIGASPVVETAMRIPSGEAVHRAYSIGGDSGDDELAIVEIENRSRVPFAVALAVRPYNPEGLAVIERIELHDGTTVTVDGRVALLLPKAPARVAASTFHEGDSAASVMGGTATTADAFPSRRDEAGWRKPRSSTRCRTPPRCACALPMVASKRTRRRGRTRRRVERAPSYPTAIPSPAQVASGWSVQSSGGLRLVLPDERMQEAVDANCRFLLVLHDGADITPGPSTYHRFWFRDAAFLLAALDRYGFHAQAAEVLASYPGRQRVDGFFLSQPREWDANGCALWALAEHWRLTRDRDLLDAVVGSVAKGAHWIDRKRGSETATRSRAVRVAARRCVGRAPRSVRLLLLGRLLGCRRPAVGRRVAGRRGTERGRR